LVPHTAPVVTCQPFAAGASPGLPDPLEPPRVLAPFSGDTPPVLRAVPTWFAQMETPIGFTTEGSLVAYYARYEINRSCQDAHSVTMAICVTECFVMDCNRWDYKARDCRFWLFSDGLFGWVKQLNPDELAGVDAHALGVFLAVLSLRTALPVQNQAFHDAVGRLDTSRRDREGWLTVVTRRDANGVRIVIQDPLDAAAYSIPASCTAVPANATLGRAQVPLAYPITAHKVYPDNPW